MKITVLKSENLENAEAAPFENLPFMWAVEGTGGNVRNSIDFTSADGLLTAGPASFERMTLQVEGFPVDEYMYLLEGELEITDSEGTVTKFGPGDCFVMPRGFKGTWRQLTPIKKFAVTYTPAE